MVLLNYPQIRVNLELWSLFFQELLSRQHEGKRTKTQTDRLEAQLQTEMKIRTDLENRNTSLDQEISKVYKLTLQK